MKYAPLSADAEMVNVSTTKYLDASASLVAMPDPIPYGSTTPLVLSEPVPLIKADVYHEGEPIFLRLTDGDQNIDATVAETILLTLDCQGVAETETIQLTETGPDTGVFVGYIQSVTVSAVVNNGSFSVCENCQITASYEDKCGPNGTGTNTVVEASALIDPFGLVFDSATGEPLDGAVVTLLDAASGLPAAIYGDDGVSVYPSTVTTGGTATDSSGAVYSFSPGSYRFPYVLPGRYRFDVTPPTSYRWPSTASDDDLDSLSGGPFAIETGSKGEEFVVDPGPALHIDIPLDPVYSWLYLSKTASKDTVSIGDFLQYKITVENTSTDYEVQDIVVADKLPLGFRYREGSAKIGGVSASDPSISSDGRTLSFTVGSLAAGGSTEITYVVEVAAGAKLGKATNSAYATGSTTIAEAKVASNTARATVEVKEDLFGSKTIIMGRVFPGCTDGSSPQSSANDGQKASGSEDGVAGVRIYLEDGRYVVTDKKGMYHFEGLNPGTHVVQLDHVTIPDGYELVSCEENDRFAGVPYSQFVDLQGGTMWRADFYLLPKPKKEATKLDEPEFIEIKGEVSIELNSVLSNSECEMQNAECKNKIEYEVPIRVGKASLKNLRLSVILPGGITYIKDSSRLGDVSFPDPHEMENVLTYRFGDVEPEWEGKIKFRAWVLSEGGEGEFATKAMLTFDAGEAKNRRTPLVENILSRVKINEIATWPPIVLHPHFVSGSAVLNSEDKAQLENIVNELKEFDLETMHVTGHTDSQRIGKRLKKTFVDNYELSLARARSVAEYLAAALKLAPSQITIDGKGPDVPIAGNETVEGMTQNRRVELKISAKKENTSFELKNTKDKSGVKAAEVNEKVPNTKQADPPAEEKKTDKKTMPEFDEAWLNKADPGLAFVWPLEGHYPPIPSLRIAIKHDSGKKLRLLMDGEDVDPLYLDGTKKRGDNQAAVSLWIGIPLKEGDNLFEAVEYGQNGNEEGRISRTIHYSRPPVKAVLVPEKSRLAVDGKTPSVIAVRLTDKDGHPAREGVVGEYKVLPPFLPLQKVENLQIDPLIMSKSERLKYAVGEDGMAFIELQPTSNTGEATVRFNLMSGEQEVKVWLTPMERDWILVGLAEGTVGYNAVSGNMESLDSSGVEDKYYDDGRLAFFAKGMIKGKWLLTLAYDGDKPGVKDNDSLYGTIAPDKYYTLYGDATQQGYEAASARSLYIKIERDKFYALFGDFETGLTVTELSKYTRNLNGFKSEMKGEKFDFNVFASDTNQAFVKDEIRGDGTSGLYSLSRKDIVMNSESVTIETRDRFKSEEIISSTSMTRYTDYDIDYEAGTIYFKSPVYSSDEDFNPIYIVVTYESFDGSDMSFNYGGRGAVRMLENKVELGATYIHEGQKGGDGDLTGVDAKLKLDDTTTIRAEYAATDAKVDGVDSRGRAYLAEVTRRSEKLEGKAYIREQETDFGLGQQNVSESGTRKAGFDGTYRLDEKISIKADVYRQRDLSTDETNDMAEAQARYNEKQYELHGGLRYAEDESDDGEVSTSEQVTAGGAYRMMEGRLVLSLEHEQSLFNRNDSADYPTRTTAAADYKLSDTASLFATQEFADGDDSDTWTTRAGIKASPWSDGQISSSLEQEYAENGARVFAVNGLKQGWQVTKKFSVDGGLDRSETLRDDDETSESSDFTAFSLGAAYKEEKWSVTGRVEKRDSDDEDKVGVFTGAYGEVKEGLGLAAAFQAFMTRSSSGADSTGGDLRLSLAYRPKETKWIVLDRLDYIFEEEEGDGSDYDNWRIVNNINANYKADRKTQISLQYGAKYVNETIDDEDYSGYTDLMGLEGRYDATKKWDVGLRGSILHSWDVDQYKYCYGPSVGYNFVKNVWISVGYNIDGFRDEDFSKSDFTSEGPYLKFRMKFDQGTAKEAVKWFSGQ